MVKRRVIRVLTVQNPILYFVDRGREIGTTYETIKAFEKRLNEKLRQQDRDHARHRDPGGARPAHPAAPGREGDIAAAALTITPARKKKVDFSAPFATGVREVQVSGPGAPPVATLDDLSGKEVYVRPSSAYAEHIGILNKRFEKEGKPPLTITPPRRSSRTATSSRWSRPGSSRRRWRTTSSRTCTCRCSRP